ncbi:cytochrome P450 [Gloeophyllum trabeum ATCC 11539]|uniref:Cytochrome P450 n=1 Tax=Gloeophyllum trabeum (strain ATCC 11539 / FP-39264 / Madison 617) TaxID=670483 RepID=S7PXV3_GLOTA|nr:cytochrome P450 [Gloeophyllum trabeum ATCC 11539]EPQ52446.1 cytochrome P450 [Gloeophyllum trabeum ATCC 11539]
MGKKYGNMLYFHMPGRSIVVLNSAKAAHDLLDKKSSIYSHRPYFAMTHDVIGWDWALPIMDYGEKFKRHRRYLEEYFRKRRLPNYYATQTREVHRTLFDMLEDPENYQIHFKRLAGGITMMMSYGHEVKSKDDEFIRIAEKGVATIDAAGAVGAHIVDFFPWLRHIPDWMPGAGFKRLPPGTREDMHAFVNRPFEEVLKRMADGTAVPCYTMQMLEETKGKDNEGVRDTAAITFSAGFDTTYSALMTVLIAMLLNPVIQARAQAEMDLVVGKDRLPTFEDREHLPYLQCIILESMRWGSTTPVGVPHRLCQDDVYNGYHLPKDTMVIANAYAMLYDPEVYPNPEEFNPDRFLTGEGRTPQPDPRGPAFGFGRRVCPGKDIAENNIWISTASLFYAFKITPAIDENGREIPIDSTFAEHSVRHPKPFKCTITPRRENSRALIQQAAWAKGVLSAGHEDS